VTLLEGARVLDLTTSPAGAYATRHLADLGATVVRADAGGERDRRWALRNRHKWMVDDDPGGPGAPFEVVVHDSPAEGGESAAARWPLADEVLEVRITDGDAPDEPLQPSFAMSALGGLSGLCGDQSPVTPEPVLAAQLVALFAATAAVAWLAGDRSTRRIEIVAEECVASCLESALPIFFVDGVAVRRRPNLHDLCWPASSYRTADGWVGITAGRVEDADKLLTLVGLERLIDPSVTAFEQLVPRVDALEPELTRALLGWRTAELVETSQRLGLAIAPALWPAQLHTDEHVVARGFVQDDGQGGMLVYPALLDGRRPQADDGRAAVSPAGRSVAPAAGSDGPMARPLGGVRVVDLTWALAGPFATMVLADLGADVVKIESEAHIDSSRLVGPYVGPHDSDHSGYFRFFNRDKRSLRCDFAAEPDRAALLELVALGDVVVENFRAGAMDRKGLGYDDLTAVRPSLVMCSISGFGRTGPRRDWRSYGAGMAETHSGLAAATGGERPIVPARSFADCIAGLYGALTICAQLYGQRVRGEGSYADLAQFEACAATVDELAVVGPDPDEAHAVEGSDRDGWRVTGTRGTWPVLAPDEVGNRSLAEGFCTSWPRTDGRTDVYAGFPGRFEGRRYEITRPGPDLGEHRVDDVWAEWAGARAVGRAQAPAS
jgi:crotonobetainyl-CoA:carnitine CoA-transferase CaiB-like acyl-CoA transferase